MPIDTLLLAAGVVSFIGGLVRGFTGFGGALIFVPLVSALYEPARTAPTLFIIDTLTTLPMTIRAARVCAWPQVLPMAVVAALCAPVGVYALSVADPVAFRWALSALAAAILILLISGWRYQGQPTLPATLSVGALSGFLGGAAQLSGAPVAAFWLGGQGLPSVIRGNLIAYFGVLSIASGLSLFAAGLFTPEVGWMSLWLGPLYGLGLVLGQRRFIGASDAGYRRMAYAIIGLSAVLSAPAWDGLWR
jgi:uncharacterized membrane protein YfcA